MLPFMISRRSVLSSCVTAGIAALLPRNGQSGTPAVREYALVAAPSSASIVGTAVPQQTRVWAYRGSVPGPELRVRQGDRLRVRVENLLPEETTVHWHGVRVPNAMDGVPHLTQPPIAPGSTFVYEFDCPDAGTYWYHPHTRSFEQVERGLAGALIVEEPQPIAVDRDLVWVLDDWRTPGAQISEDFGNMMDISHAGRLGNTVTINGRVPEQFALRSGERIRLRLVNAANARIFGLEFQGHQPFVPWARCEQALTQRADLVLDCLGQPGDKYTVFDRFYSQQQYRLLDLVYGSSPPVRQSPLNESMRLPPNPLAEPDQQNAMRHTVEFGGGMMDPKMMRGMGAEGGEWA